MFPNKICSKLSKKCYKRNEKCSQWKLLQIEQKIAISKWKIVAYIYTVICGSLGPSMAYFGLVYPFVVLYVLVLSCMAFYYLVSYQYNEYNSFYLSFIQFIGKRFCPGNLPPPPSAWTSTGWVSTGIASMAKAASITTLVPSTWFMAFGKAWPFWLKKA